VLEPTWTEHRKNPELGAPSINMQGRRIYRWASQELPRIAIAAVKAAGLPMDDIDIFVPHQANLRITEAIVRALDLPQSVVVATDVITAGNTSSASIPLAIHKLLADGTAHTGALALLLGFGGGLSYAAQVVRLP